MAIPEDRLSTEVVDGDYISPENDIRTSFKHDIEGGPKGIEDTSEGMNFQKWEAGYYGLGIALTPEDVGDPVFVISRAENLEQLSFCFDQNARPSIVWVALGTAYLYWYDSSVAEFVTTPFAGVQSAILSLDDKRELQVGANDIIFWYTKEVAADTYNLYHRKQRERFTVEYLMAEDTYPNIWKAGMHKGLRGKIILTHRAIQ